MYNVKEPERMKKYYDKCKACKTKEDVKEVYDEVSQDLANNKFEQNEFMALEKVLKPCQDIMRDDENE